MSVVKFPCTQCQKLMAVGPDLVGRPVRCPHCQVVLVAPTGDSAPSALPTEANDVFQFTNSEAVPRSAVAGDGRPDMARTPLPSADLSFEPSPRPQPADDSRKPEASARPKDRAAGRSAWFAAILVPYAAFMTVVAIFYYVKYSNAAQEHPLEQIPDLLGEFQQKQSKGGAQSKRLPRADQDLPARLITTLGQPIRVGAIEVTPLSIEYRPWAAFVKYKGRPEPSRRPIDRTLVLRLRLRNVSNDLTFYPTDPYFDRRPKDGTEKPYTLVEVGGEKFYGGVIQYIIEPGATERAWLEGREGESQPLGPGQSRETVLLTFPKNKVFDAVEKSGGRAVWRVQVRRGMVPYEGTEIPASAVVGVAFTAADVKRAG